MYKTADLVFPFGAAALTGKLKQSIEDFQVYEQLGFEPTGEGEHLYLWIEKINQTTDVVNQYLARHYGVKPYHIGHCGLKDKNAITRQWFSVHLPHIHEFPKDPQAEDFKVLKRAWSLKKLKIGVHQSNQFVITLREVKGDFDRAIKQLEKIQQLGFINYFGEQRFGKGQKNVANAVDAFTYGKKLSRAKKSLYLSSIRSFLYNETLCNRIQQHGLRLLSGDCFMLEGSRSIFCDPIDSAIEQRFKAADIHPIISLAGDGEALVRDKPLELEKAVAKQYPELLAILQQQGMKQDKRAIRQMVKNLSYEFSGNSLKIRFDLPKGSYATTLIQHFCRY